MYENNDNKLEKLSKKELEQWFKINEERFANVFQHLTCYHVTKLKLLKTILKQQKNIFGGHLPSTII